MSWIGVVAAAGTAAVIAVAWPIFWWFEVRRLEKPKYTVIRKLSQGARGRRSWFASSAALLFSHTQQGEGELRMYAPTLVAEVEVEDDNMRGAMSQGFRQVGGFIFGKNTAASAHAGFERVAMTSPVVTEMPKSENVAMTSPVVAELVSDNKYKVSFVMPSKYTAATLPKPNNPNVRIKEVPGRLMAAIGFSGKMPSLERVHVYKSKLEEAMHVEGLVVEGPPVLLQYHPPFAPGFVRHNEVLLPVKK